VQWDFEMFSILKKMIRSLGVISVIGLYGCGGSDASPNLAIAIAVVNTAPVSVCPSGGMTIQSGVDANGDQVLDALEASNLQFICNGANGANGVNGVNGAVSLSPLISVNPESAGVNCSSGGSQVNVGLDINRNSILDISEITSVSYVCHGNSSATGTNGVNGTAGTNGTNGATGAAGSTGATGTAGANGTNGTNGTAGATGTTGTNGTNGTTGATGSTGSTGAIGSIGANGLVSLLSIVNEPSGANCAYAGLKVSSGIDTNGNNSLDAGEIQSTKYVCNGAPASTVFAYVYNVREQTVDKDAAIDFDSTGAISGVSHKGTEIGINSSGLYLISYAVSGTEPNQFALFINGRILEQSVYGSGAGTQPNYGQVIVELRAESVVTLVNVTGATAVGLASKVGGDKANVNASLTLLKLNP
jgi:hypothetical protein